MLKAVRLRTEYLENPIGIDIRIPQLGWNLEGDGKKQTAFQICAAHTEEDLKNGNLVWDSGKIQSYSMQHHEYGSNLTSREIVFWRVRIWDETEKAGEWSAPAVFEMGLLEKEDWEADWISGDYDADRTKRYPADEFRKVINVENLTEMICARMYISACGLYETYLNGKRVGDQVFTPGFTDYDKRIQYQTYDITELLRSGENTWDISLGDGWYRGKMGVFGASYVYGKTTAVIGQIELTYRDGTRKKLCTDKSFSWSDNGPVRFNDMKDGESIDGGRMPSYSGKTRIVEKKAELCCSNNVPVREQEVFHPVILHTPDGCTVLDFGQNIAGYVEFSVKGVKGHTVKMRMGEMLDEDGNFTVRNLITEDTTPDHIPDYCDDSRFQTVEYTCGSSKREQWKPKFCVQGFRYVKLEDWPEEARSEHFQAIAVYSDMEELCDFHCSSGNVEKLVNNTLWSMKGNFLDVPTDCPTRERAPWLGDAQLFFDAGTYFMDFTSFFRKWIRDIYDDQAPDGKVYNIVPRVDAHGGMNEFVEGSSGWTDAGILIPYRYWKHYGDLRLLRKYYGSMKKLADFMISRMGDESDPELDQKLEPGELRKYIVTAGFHFGEWNEPGSTPMDVVLPKYEEATAYLSYSMGCLTEMADALGEREDADRYRGIRENTRKAYQHYFLKNNSVGSDRMCCYVRPLALGLVSEESRVLVRRGLVANARRNGYHVGTGFLSTPFVLNMLTEAGDTEGAYKMLENEEYPSWIYEIRQGATTVWENWDGSASRNHYSNGACCDWIFNTVCGIRVIGENRFSIAPKPGGSLDHALLRYRSLYGEVKSGWEKEEDAVRYSIMIPAGCEAELRLPDQEMKILTSGSYIFEVKQGG